MNSPINFLPFLVGGLMIGLAVFHEWCWYRRYQRGVRLDGEVIGEAQDGEDPDPHAIVEYTHHGRRYRFVSRYGGGSVRTGDRAAVIHDLETGNAEHITLTNRWTFTCGPLLLGLMFVIAGVSMMRQAEIASDNLPGNPTADQSEVAHSVSEGGPP